jgi:WD40 repeat protein
VVALLEDVRSTVQAFLTPIQASALHIYHSALVFMPRCLLYETYSSSADAVSICQLLTPRRSHWESSSTVLEGHSKAVTHVVFSADGTSLASSSHDRTTRVWDVSTGQQRESLSHDSSVSLGLAFPSHDACVFLATETSGGRKLQPEVRSLTSGKTLSNFNTDLRVSSGAHASYIAANGVRIAVLGGDTSPESHTLQIWDAGSGKQVLVLEAHSAPVNCCAFSPDSRYIATGASRSDKTLRLWDAVNGKTIAVREHGDTVRAVTFSAKSSRIASACNNLVHVWDFCADPNAVAVAVFTSLNIPDGVTVEAVTFIATRVAAGYSDGSIRLWDTETASAIWVLRAHNGGISALATSIDGTRLASASKDCTLRIWELEIERDHFERSVCGQNEKISEPIACVAISPTATHIVTAFADRLEVWDARAGQRVSIMQTPGANKVAFSHDGARFLSLHELEAQGIKVRLWDTLSMNQICALEPRAPHAQILHYPRFSSDGKTITMSQYGTTTTTWVTGKDFPALISGRGARVPDRNIGCAPFEPEAGWMHFIDLPRDPAGGMPRRMFWVPPEYRWPAQDHRDHIASAGLHVAIGGVGHVLAIADCTAFRKLLDYVDST